MYDLFMMMRSKTDYPNKNTINVLRWLVLLVLLAGALGTTLVAAETIETSRGFLSSAAPVGKIVLWNFTTDFHEPSARLVVNGILYVTDSNILYAVDAQDGIELWRFTADAPIRLYDISGGVAFAFAGKSVYALDAGSGSEKWRFIADSPVGRPKISSTGIICFNSGPLVYCLDITTGAEKWRFGAPADFGEVLLVRWTASPDVLYAGAGDTFYAILTSSGREQWHQHYTGWNASYPAAESANNIFFWTGRHSDVADQGQFLALSKVSGRVQWTFLTGQKPELWWSPTVYGNIVYSAFGYEELHKRVVGVTALDAVSGKTIWGHGMGDYSNPVWLISGGKAFLHVKSSQPSGTGNIITALDAYTGFTLWDTSQTGETLAGGDVGSGPVVADGYYYYASGSPDKGGGICALDTGSGQLAWKTSVGSGTYTQNLLVAGGIIYVANTDGNLYALGDVPGNDGGDQPEENPDGSLYVVSYPSGATIRINGIARGTTNRLVPDVPAGNRNLTLTKDGYQPYSTTVAITAGEAKVLPPITLVKGDGGSGGGRGSLYVASIPGGATILINCTEYGTTNTYLPNVPAGPQNLTLVKDGYEAYTTMVDIPAGGLKVLKPITLTQALPGGCKCPCMLCLPDSCLCVS